MNKDYTLILAILTTESSYAQQIERPMSGVPDTVQVWFSPQGQWRIRTYAIDHDLRVDLINPYDDKKYTKEMATVYIKNHYQDVISKMCVFEFSNPDDPEEVHHALSVQNFKGMLDFSHPGFVFYNPDEGLYTAQTGSE